MQVNRNNILITSVLSIGLLTAGCGSLPNESAEAESQRREGKEEGSDAVPVDASIARTGMLQKDP